MKLEYGHPIDTKLSDFLLEFTNSDDIADAIANTTGAGISTIFAVRKRRNTLTEKSEPAIVFLTERALKKAEETAKRINEFKSYLKAK